MRRKLWWHLNGTRSPGSRREVADNVTHDSAQYVDPFALSFGAYVYAPRSDKICLLVVPLSLRDRQTSAQTFYSFRRIVDADTMRNLWQTF